MYKASVENPDKFWGEQAEKNLTWFKKWDKVLDYDFHKPYIKWFQGGKLNASVQCLDRFVNTPTRNKAAIIWEADGGTYRTFTYQTSAPRSRTLLSSAAQGPARSTWSPAATPGGTRK